MTVVYFNVCLITFRKDDILNLSINEGTGGVYDRHYRRPYLTYCDESDL